MQTGNLHLFPKIPFSKRLAFKNCSISVRRVLAQQKFKRKTKLQFIGGYRTLRYANILLIFNIVALPIILFKSF